MGEEKMLLSFTMRYVCVSTRHSYRDWSLAIILFPVLGWTFGQLFCLLP